MRGAWLYFVVVLLFVGTARLPAQAQTPPPPNKIQNCTDILSRLQIPGQSTNPERIIQCRDDVKWFDPVQQYDRMAVIVTTEFPDYVNFFLQGQGFSIAGWHQCLNPIAAPPSCQGNNFSLNRYFSDDSVSQWAAKAYTGTATSPGRYFDNFMQPPILCAATTAGTVVQAKDASNQTVDFPCRTTSTDLPGNPFGHFNSSGALDIYPRNNTTVTKQYALIFERVLTVSFTANPGFINPGQSATLSWETEGAVSVAIDNDIGSVALDGSLEVSPSVDTLYTLTATASGGEVAIRRVTVDVLDSCEPGGGTGGSGLLPDKFVDRAWAQNQVCKPDLILVTDGARVSVTTRSGQVHQATNLEQIGVGSDISNIKVEGVKVKNIGTATAEGQTTFAPNYVPMLKYDSYPELSVSLNLAVNATVILPALNIPYGLGLIFPDDGQARGERMRDNLGLEINQPAQIAELNDKNNVSTVGWLKWAAIKAVTKYEGAVVDFETAGSQLRSAVTDADKRAFLVPTDSLYSGSKTYNVTLKVGANVIGQTTVQVTDYLLYAIEVQARSRLTVKVAPKIEYAHKGPYFLKPASGTVTIESRTGQQHTDTIVNGFAVFTEEDIIPGDYRVVRSTTSLFDIEDTLSFNFPETTRSEEAGPFITVPAEGTFYMQTLLLGKKCQTIHSLPLSFCDYNDQESIAQFAADTLPKIKQVSDMMLNWRQASPIALKTIIHSPDPRRTAAGYYALADYVVTNGRPSYSSDTQQAIVWHEIFHLLDDYYADNRLGGKYLSLDGANQGGAYFTNALNQFESVTGRRLWDLTLSADSYQGGAGYSSSTVYSHKGNTTTLKAHEIFAQEHEIICHYPTVYRDRLANVRTLWQSTYNQQPPSDLDAQIETQRKRLEGRLPGITPATVKTNNYLKTWYDNCTNK